MDFGKKGVYFAYTRDLDLNTTDQDVDGLLPHVRRDDIQIAFDATSAYVHPENSRKLNALGVMMIDLTPTATFRPRVRISLSPPTCYPMRPPRGKRRGDYFRSTGITPQIFSEYSRIVRSLEKRPIRATLRIAFSVQRAVSR
jgi:hypothetical protein